MVIVILMLTSHLKLRNNMFNFLKKKKEVKKEVSVEVQDYLKRQFRNFFEGQTLSGIEYFAPVIAISVMKMGITDIKIEFGTEKNKHDIDCEVVDMFVTLERPGILIGKGGRVINRLERYLNGPQHHPTLTRKTNVKIIESKLWQ